MSHFLDRLTYFSQPARSRSPTATAQATGEDRTWEDAYRHRWQHDKIVRSTHGVNCTGSCSWKIYVKGGIVTWETQQTDYPRTRWDMPNHEPRGCARGASYSWYLYSANRVKYPMVRGRLLEAVARGARCTPAAGRRLGLRSSRRRCPPQSYQERARPGRLRALQLGRGQRDDRRGQHPHDQAARAGPHHRLLADPGDVHGQLRRGQPLPVADRRRLHELLRLVLRPAAVVSPQVWGEQTDVPESADWYNTSYIIAWGSNVPQTRTPDAHFFTEVRYKGTKTVAVTPDYSEVAKLSDLWLHPKQGTDAALAMAMGHVILKEFYFDQRSAYFDDYARRYTDLPMLVHAEGAGAAFRRSRPGAGPLPARQRLQRQAGPGEQPRVEDRGLRRRTARSCCPKGAIGFRWGPDGRPDAGQWNLEAKEARNDTDVKLKLSLLDGEHAGAAGREGRLPLLRRHRARALSRQRRTATCCCARCRCSGSSSARRARSARPLVATVFDLQAAQYGVPAAWQASTRRRASTTTRPTPRPGRRRSPACRATR